MVKVKRKNKELLTKVFYWILFLFLLYIIVQLLLKIFGGSLGFEELVIGLLIANLGYSFYLSRCIGSLNSKISGHMGWHKGKNSK